MAYLNLLTKIQCFRSDEQTCTLFVVIVQLSLVYQHEFSNFDVLFLIPSNTTNNYLVIFPTRQSYKSQNDHRKPVILICILDVLLRIIYSDYICMLWWDYAGAFLITGAVSIILNICFDILHYYWSPWEAYISHWY